MKTTPEILEALLTEGATTVTSAADAALAESAAADPADSERVGHVATASLVLS